MAEGVLVPVVGAAHLRVAAHVPDDGGGGADEDDLHDGVVERDVVGEEVEVPSDEHRQVQLLRLPRHPCGADP